MNHLNILVVLAALLLMGNKNYRDCEDEVDIETITFHVYGVGGNGVIVPEMKTPIKQGETVLDVTVRMLEEQQIPYQLGGTGDEKYVRCINRLAEGDKGPQSGWLYKINDDFPIDYPSKYKLTDKDHIQWLYTTNLGKDVGAPELREGRKNGYYSEINKKTNNIRRTFI